MTDDDVNEARHERELMRVKLAKEKLRADTLMSAIRVIYTATRQDEKSECWTIRKWLDDRDQFNDDIQGPGRLVELVCAYVMGKAKP